jgi:hypothetical protein
MAVVVAHPGADGGEAGTDGIEERTARGRAAAVVGDLQDVPAPAVRADDLQECGVTVLLEVAREQDALATD